MQSGALLVDKPAGPTSHDIVAFVRRLLRTPRVGHTGTLDPLATGLLVLLIGPATRLAQFLVADEKEYVADVRLGIATPTYDAQSLEQAQREAGDAGREARRPSDAQIAAALDRFRGTFLQTPPPFSAKKVAGVRAYERARKNDAPDLKPVAVTVHALEVLAEPAREPRASHLAPPTSHLPPPASHLEPGGLVRLRVAASAGFYVRSLAHDLGQALGCGAYLEGLRRTRVGRFRIDDAASLNDLEAAGVDAAARVIGVDALLADFPAVSLTEEGLRRAANGNSLAPQHVRTGEPRPGAGVRVRVRGAAGEVLAVAEGRADGLLHPLLVLR